MTTTRYANDIAAHFTTIEAHDCAECGIVFGLDEQFAARRRKDGRLFYCPNGHGLSWKKSLDDEALKRRLASAEANVTHLRDQRDAAERSARSYKGQVTKIKRRVGKGVCPCCNRTFQDLARHMAGQHPDYSNGGAK